MPPTSGPPVTDDNAAPVVAVEDVVRRFGDLVAVDHVSFSVHGGEVLGLLGHNGAGKTTLIRLLNGLLRPDAGRLAVHGLDPLTYGTTVRSRTGVVTSFPGLDELLDARENLRVHAGLRGLDPARLAGRGDRLLERLGLGPHLHKPTGQLSTGLKQRVALARALLHNPDVLFLDEPTANMDPVAAVQVRELLRDLDRDRSRTVILCTHNLAEAQSLCDRVVILRAGRVLARGTPEELAQQQGIGAVCLTVEPHQAATATEVAGAPTRRIRAGVLEVAIAPSEIPKLVRRLVEADVAVYGVEPRGGSLEEVYLDLHAHEDEGQPDRSEGDGRARAFVPSGRDAHL